MMRIATILIILLIGITGPREPRVKIAVIDTGIDIAATDLKPYLCKTGHKSLVDATPFVDSSRMGHGTNVAGLIAQGIDPNKACLVIIKFYSSTKTDTIGAINYAVKQHVDFINMSLGGGGYSSEEYHAIIKALGAGIKIAAAAGNDYRNLDNNCYYYPACYTESLHSKQFRVVGSNTYGGQHYTNYGSAVSDMEDGTGVGMPRLTGTSQATAVFTGKWANGDIK